MRTLRQVQGAASHVVEQAPGRRHDDVYALAQRAQLSIDRLAAVDGDAAQVAVAPQQRQVLGDLYRQLARRRQHDALDDVACWVDRLDQRDAEGGRLAGTGEGLGDDVAAAEQQRDGLCLDGRRLLEAHFLQGAGHRAG